MSDKLHQSSSERKLAAIMFTDIVGYTSLMQKDEEQAVKTIENHRLVLEKHTQNCHGQILQYYGDGSLSIFSSALDAVECAIAIQKELSIDLKIPLRIGINLGDIVIKGEAVFGDGVNIASRLESLGVSGSILISDTIFHLVNNHPEIKTVSLGNFNLKNVDYPVPVYALSNDFLSVPKAENLEGRVSSFSKKSPWIIAISIVILIVVGIGSYWYFSIKKVQAELIEKSVAVLPFSNLSDDPQQEYFSDGITDDVINHLVRISDLKVKSRTTTEQYKSPKKTIPDIGCELGVSYILEGSVRKNENKVRIVAQLIDVSNDLHVWSETYDREFTEIFEVQSEIAIEIAQTLKASLTPAERRHVQGGPWRRRRSSEINAYDYELKAREKYRSWNDEKDLKDALNLIGNAIKIDSTYARGYALIGNILHYGMRTYGVSTDVWIGEALEMAEKAISLDSSLADAYLLRGNILITQYGNSEEALEDLKKAHALEPGNPDVLQSLGKNYMRDGEYEKAAIMIIKSIEREYSIKDSEYYFNWGNLYHWVDEYELAEEYYQKAISLEPDWTMPYYSIGQLYRYWGKFDLSEEYLLKCYEISPLDQQIIDAIGWTNLMENDLEDAGRYWSMYDQIELQFTDSSQYVPFLHRLGYVRYLQGDTSSAVALINEQLRRDLDRHQKIRGYGVWSNGGFYYDIAASNSFLDNQQEAVSWLDSAYQKGFISVWYLQNDPLLENIRTTPEFLNIQNELEARQQNQQRAFKKVIDEYNSHREQNIL